MLATKLAVCLGLAGPATGAAAAAEGRGIVVESVVAGAAGERAGLQVGDVLWSWTRAPRAPANLSEAGGELGSPLDLEAVELEQAPRGTVTLAGQRDGAPFTATLPAGEWLVGTRPVLDNGALASYREDPLRPRACLDAVEESIADAELATWLLVRCQRAWDLAGAWPEVERLEALAARLSGLGSARARAALSGSLGDSLLRRQDWKRAEQAYAAQQELLEGAQPDSLTLAATLLKRSLALRDHGSAERQRELLERTLELRTREAPGSLAVAEAQLRLAQFWTRRDQSRAEALADQALRLAESLAPESLTGARAHVAAAGAGQLHYRLAETERHWRRAAELLARLLPTSSEYAVALNHLADLRWRLGDAAGAQGYLAAAERLARERNLGADLLSRILGTRAVVASLQGEDRESIRLSEEALALIEGLGLPTLRVAVLLNNLAVKQVQAGDLAGAEPRIRRGLALMEADDPRSPYHALLLRASARLERARGQLEAARKACERALAIDAAFFLDLPEEVDDRVCLGRLERAAGNREQALQHFARGLAIAESARERQAGDAEQGSRAIGPIADVYAEYAATLADASRAGEALEVLERFHARSLLQQLGERDLADDSGLSPELARERREAEAAFVSARAELSALPSSADPRQREAPRLRAEEARRRLEEVARRVRREAPGLAARQYPDALDLQRLREALDPGTLLLAYSVGEERSLLLALLPSSEPGPGVQAFPLAIGREQLGVRIDAFLSLLRRAPTTESRLALQRQAGELFETLLRPAWPLASSARRLLISPDYPLGSLPFAALHDGARHLVELKPVHLCASASVYARLRMLRARSGPAHTRVAVFGDPLYTTSQPALTARSDAAALRALESLGRLPSARREAETVARLFRERVDLHLGAQASERTARALGPGTRLVHFASHAFADERTPFHSALVLSAPVSGQREAGEDGLLEAWEIGEHMRLDAQLVTLSACETALGANVAGEGLLGLTRAFLKAGARSVLGSLWRVPDEATAVLMERFYREFTGGATKDEALRRAQASLLRGRWRDPFYWAAFQFEGDWR